VNIDDLTSSVHPSKLHTQTSQHETSSTQQTMTAFMRLIHLGQALLSGYGALHSYIAVTNLQKYEKTSEKLAEWSKDAANELHKTRTTQTTAALAVCIVPSYQIDLEATNIQLPDPPLDPSLINPRHHPLLPAASRRLRRLAMPGDHGLTCTRTREELLGAFGRQDCRVESAAAQHGRLQ